VLYTRNSLFVREKQVFLLTLRDSRYQLLSQGMMWVVLFDRSILLGTRASKVTLPPYVAALTDNT
jgi:hypothetical protein